MRDASFEWISRSAHFAVNPIPLEEEWHCTVAVAEWRWQHTRVEFQSPVAPSPAVSESDSNPQLQGNTPQPTRWPGLADELTNMRGARTVSVKQRGRPLKKQPMGDGGSSPPSPPYRGGADSDGGQHRQRRQRNEKCLAPACLDMPIFKTIDPNTDVMYNIWKFDVEGWLDQYDKVSMMPHIYQSLQGYPGKWVRSLEEGQNIARDLFRWMDTVFGNVRDYNSMIRSLYEIHQKETECGGVYAKDPQGSDHPPPSSSRMRVRSGKESEVGQVLSWTSAPPLQHTGFCDGRSPQEGTGG